MTAEADVDASLIPGQPTRAGCGSHPSQPHMLPPPGTQFPKRVAEMRP